ncbi:MAG: hypothetical protein GF331_00625, partial [Chitinivibrionales bacterium]|nr:hypothetical protein [Chitinivibrionales bacterium]
MCHLFALEGGQMSLQRLLTILIAMTILQAPAEGSLGTLLGHITQDTVLLTDTVSVTGEVWVDSFVVVNVAVGTVVLFEGHYAIRSRGTIVARGTEHEPIVFTARDTSVGWQGIRFEGGPLPSLPKSEFVHCRFSGGKAAESPNPSDANGGALFIGEVFHVRFDNCLFVGNSALKHGGAMYDEEGAIIEECEFRNNTCGQDGGAVYARNRIPLRVKSCRFLENIAERNGGAVCLNGTADAFLVNTVMARNTASESGALRCDDTDTLSLLNCTIVDNRGDYAVQIESAGPTFVRNTICHGNGRGEFGFYKLSPHHADFYNCDLHYSYYPLIPIGGGSQVQGVFENCIDIDPRLDSSFVPALTSPCRNAGMADLDGIDIPPYDLLGNPRVFGDTIDIGAVENQQTGCVVGGVITNDTTWSPGCTVLVAYEDVTIAEGATLTIEPGVVVDFTWPQAIRVQGRLLAEGTPTDTIRFLVSDTSGEAWGGIRFDSTSASNDSSIISYCALSNGGGAPIRPTGGAAVGGLVAALWFSKIHISNNAFRFAGAMYGGAIACRDANPVIVNNTFDHVAASYGSALWCRRSAPVFEGNQVLNCTGAGAAIYLDSASVDVTNCTIAHNRTCGMHFENGAGGTVLNTILWGNHVLSARLDTSGAIILDSSSLQVTITDSTSSPDFTHCCIEDDTSGFEMPDAVTYTGIVTSLFSSDPEFVAPASGDLRLLSTSVCINRGWPQTQSLTAQDQWG